MTLHKRNGIWYWRKMVKGEVFSRSTKTADKKLAEQIVKQWAHEAVKTVVYDGERPVSLHEAIEGFLDERMHTPGYQSACKHLGHWKNALANVPMKSLRQHEVKAVVAKRVREGTAHNTIAVFVTYWNALINYCIKKKLSPGPKLERVKQKRTRLRVISSEEEQSLLAAVCPNAKYSGKNSIKDGMRQDNQDLIVCLLHLGARISEASNLRWSDIHFDQNTVLVRRVKRGDECLLLMTKSLRTVMERRYETRIDNNVFPTKANRVIRTQWLNDAVKRSGVDVEGGKITSHTFRHSCATRLLRAGMDITKVQRFLGHKNIQSTLVYLHALPSEVAQQAAAVFDGG